MTKNNVTKGNDEVMYATVLGWLNIIRGKWLVATGHAIKDGRLKPKLNSEALFAERFNRLSIRVLGYIAGNSWVAHALEVDVIGCGETPKEALVNMRRNLLDMIELAVKKNDCGHLMCAASSEHFESFQKHHSCVLLNALFPDQVSVPEGYFIEEFLLDELPQS